MAEWLAARLTPIRTLAVRDLKIARTYRVAIVLELAFGLLNLAVFYFISRLIESGELALPTPGSYFDFAAIGIAIAVVIEAGVAGISVRLREEQLTGTLEGLMLQPLRSSEFAIGLGALPLAIGSARVVAYLLAGVLFLGLDLGNADWAGALIILISIVAALFSIGAAVAAATLVVKRSEVVIGVAAFAIAILGGAFFPISELPEPIRQLAEVLPTRLVFDGARDALLVGSGWGEEALGLGLFALIGLPLSFLLFRASLRSARRRGTLSEY